MTNEKIMCLGHEIKDASDIIKAVNVEVDVLQFIKELNLDLLIISENGLLKNTISNFETISNVFLTISQLSKSQNL